MKKIIAILICFLLLFSSIPVCAVSNSTDDKDMPVVVSLGDSYSSGEGVQPYYGQETEDKYTCEDWIAHRSTYAWPGLIRYNGKSLSSNKATNPIVGDGLHLVEGKTDGSWYFTAVSGAVTHNVRFGEQTKDVAKGPFATLKAQIDVVKEVQKNQDIDYITMTIGGNDVGFADIMISAATSSVIDMSGFQNKLITVIETFWDENSYADKLNATYKEILEASPSATLVIAGYPQLLHLKEDGTGVGGLFNYTECSLIADAVYIFNNYLQTIVNKLNNDNIIFVDVQDKFNNHAAYSDDAYITGISLDSKENVDSSLIGSASFHPNEKGVQAYAEAVQEALAKIDSGFADTYYNTKTNLEVYDTNGELYNNYTVNISGKEYKDIIGTFDFWGLWKQDYSKKFKVSKNEPFTLELPKGNYTLTVTDNSDETKTITKPIKIRDNNENTTLQLISNFGESGASYNPNSQKDYEAILQAFLSTKEYFTYTGNIESSKLQYVIYDINSDNVPELLMQSTNDAPFYTTWTFALDNEKVALVDERYGYGQYRYSEKHNMLLVSPETKPFSGTGTTPFYSLEQNNLVYKFQVGEDLGENFYSDNNGQKIITQEERATYFENIINFTWLSIDDFVITQTSETSSTERDIVLVLDVSGSMSGTPMEETKKASKNFISTILKENASIGIVTYDNTAKMLSTFSTNESVLNAIANSIDDGGGTNIESGLQMAESMLSTSNAEKKIIVLMSDGSPNDGKVGDELISYADSIKDKGIYIYTLGFFESMGSSKSSAQILMEEIASDGCHYEVADADNLVFFFGDIADQINGQKYIYVRIACPVDVTVTYDGETLCSVEDDLNTRTNFGSLTFEDNEKEAEDSSDNRIKVLRLKDGTDYDIKIEGNGRGRMNYTIGFMDETGEYSDLRKFTNIRISKRTQIDTVATNSSSTILNVDEDGDGKYDLKYKAKANGRGEIVDYTYLIYISIGAVVLIAILIIYIKFKKRSKNKNKT